MINISTQFHADLSDAPAGEDHWVSVAGKRIPLVPHTDETRAAAFAAAPLLQADRAGCRVTHYAAEAVPIASTTVIRVHLRHSLKTSPNAVGRTGVSHSAIYVPPVGDRLAALAPDHVEHTRIDYVSTAKSFLFHHPDIINNDTKLSSLILNDYMTDDETISLAVNNLALTMRSLGPPTETGGWANLVPFQMPADPDDDIDHPTDDDAAADATPRRARSTSGETYYSQVPTTAVQTAAFEPIKPLLIRIKNAQEFKDKKWTVEPGQAVVPAAPSPQMVEAGTIRLATPSPTGEAAAAPQGDNWQAAVSNTNAISGLTTSIAIKNAAQKQITITMENTYIRYLAAYIRFYDADGNALSVPNWKPDGAGIAYDVVTDLDIQYDDVRYIGYLAPMNNVLAIPFGPAGELVVDVTFPPGAVSASVYGSGLGTGHDRWPKTPVFGGVLTGVFNLGVPAFMLGFGVAAQTYKPLYDIIDGLSKNKKFIALVGTVVLGWSGYIAGGSAYNKKMNWSSFTSLVSLIFGKAAGKALLWVEAELAGGEIEDEIPFAGWIMLAINIAAGIAQMAETIVEVATSDWNIENTVATTITTTVTVHPDPRHAAFPVGQAGAARSIVAKMTYQDQKRGTVLQTVSVPDGSTAASLAAVFAGNTLGGQVKFEVDFYVGTWLAAKATTGYMPNDDAHVADVTVYLVQYPVPLTAQSVYTHSQLLTYADDAFAWTTTATAPTATITSRDISATGNAFGDWTSITLSQRAGMLGIAWQAAGLGIVDCQNGASGQLYAFQNLDIPGTPMSAVKFPTCGFTGQTRLIYDPYPPKFLMKDGNWVLNPNTNQPQPDPNDNPLGDYYVDPRSAGIDFDSGGGFHLRKVTLDAGTPFDTSASQLSYGRFTFFPDSVALHPSGILVGISSKYQKLQVVTLVREGAADTDVPLATVGSGPAEDEAREGLMFYPVSVTCAYDGTIIVLEDTKSSTGTSTTVVSRLSAYDLHMNPVRRFFDQDGNPSQWLYLDDSANLNYLDLASVGDDQMTYIYVLYYTGQGANPSDYSMAIYTCGTTKPAGNPLVTTPSFTAARVTVDMWHTAYALNTKGSDFDYGAAAARLAEAAAQLRTVQQLRRGK